MDLAPIVLFVYNRKEHAQQTVEALLKNCECKQSDLYIYSDGSKDEQSDADVAETRKYIDTVTGFKSVTIIKRDKNWGLAANLIDGISTIVEKYGRVIVLEDDIITSPYFLKFMNEALERYKDDNRVASIQGYTYPVKEELPEAFFIRCQGCWGWATWERAWKKFNPDSEYLYKEILRKDLVREFNVDDTYYYMKMLRDQRDGKINSWAIRWYASVFLENMLVLNPGKSLVFNCGFDGHGGTHCTEENHKFDTILNNSPIDWAKVGNVSECKQSKNAYVSFLKRTALGRRGVIGRFLHHLHLDFLMIGPLKKNRWQN